MFKMDLNSALLFFEYFARFKLFKSFNRKIIGPIVKFKRYLKVVT